jgi:uncharacterized protein (DUF1810 family)
MTHSDLIRFIDAQDPIQHRVVAELAAGCKETHWMWFVFPQIEGLGSSPTARHYAIRDLGQARRYLADAMLGNRLREVVRLMLGHEERSAHDILGSPDDLKFRSCLTLFREAASEESDRELFQQGLDRFYEGRPDERTIALLRDRRGDGARAERERLRNGAAR